MANNAPTETYYYCRYEDRTFGGNDREPKVHIFREEELQIPDSETEGDEPPSPQFLPTLLQLGPPPYPDVSKDIRFDAGRPSRFKEELSIEDLNPRDSVGTGQDDDQRTENEPDHKEESELSFFQKILFFQLPWIFRFGFLFFLASWISIIPAVNHKVPGFHPQTLPIIQACTMLSLATTSLYLQGVYFRKLGWPWRRRRSDETYIFIADISLFIASLVVFALSVVLVGKDAKRRAESVQTIMSSISSETSPVSLGSPITTYTYGLEGYSAFAY